MKPKLLVILGPTATGKSDLAINLAKKYDGEIISADSRQVYKGLDIGTGKVTKKEMMGIPHHLLDIAHPKKVFSIMEWKDKADKAITDILKRGKLPIICGGTGFYIQSITEGRILPEVPPNKKLRQSLEKMSLDSLQKILKKMDSKRFKEIDQRNPVRLIRAIEIATALGKVPKVKKVKVPYSILQIGLSSEDVDLKNRINRRLDSRMKKGMKKEVEGLIKKGVSFKRLRDLGLEYRYLADLIQKKMSGKEVVQKLQTEIWQYAKRQMTWFKKDKKIKWFDREDIQGIENEVRFFLTSK